jgi:hypothetical protein
MMILKPGITAVLLSVVVSGSAMANAELSAVEVKKLFSNNTVSAYSELKKAPVSLFYDDNGEVRGIFSSGKKAATRWWVKDNGQICLKSKKGDLCFVVIDNDGNYQKFLVKADGTRVLAFSTETFSSGNINQY